jgi:hypothetical protein
LFGASNSHFDRTGGCGSAEPTLNRTIARKFQGSAEPHPPVE